MADGERRPELALKQLHAGRRVPVQEFINVDGDGKDDDAVVGQHEKAIVGGRPHRSERAHQLKHELLPQEDGVDNAVGANSQAPGHPRLHTSLGRGADEYCVAPVNWHSLQERGGYFHRPRLPASGDDRDSKSCTVVYDTVGELCH